MKRLVFPAAFAVAFALTARPAVAQEGSPWMQATAQVTHADTGAIEERTTVYQDGGDAVVFFTCGAEVAGRPTVTAVISTVQIDPKIRVDGDRVELDWTPVDDGATLILPQAAAFVSALEGGRELLVGYTAFELGSIQEALRPLPCHVAD